MRWRWETSNAELGDGRQLCWSRVVVLLRCKNGRLGLASWLDSTEQNDCDIELGNSISEPDDLNV